MDSFSQYKPPTLKIPLLNRKYHVFLSFRGKDVRKTFVDHLFESLTANGICVFCDKLKQHDIENGSKQAIVDSDISIPIFSRNYASSPWSLQELTHMCNSKAVIKHDVQPHQVRHADSQPRPAGEAGGEGESEERAENQRDAIANCKGEARAEGESEAKPYSEALKEHYRKCRYQASVIDERGQSLKKVFNINGRTPESTYGYEGRLEKGESMDDVLKLAIEDSDISIPIFSRNYASSPHCLKELAHMCKSKALIIPLFYDVRPFQVRIAESESQGSSYAEALREHYSTGRYPPETMEEWKQALHQVSNHSGWTVDSRSCLEGELVNRIVNDVINTLEKAPLLNVAQHPVQVEKKIQEVIRLLKPHNQTDVLTLGIWGMGGCGKTAIAKAVFNNIFQSFDCCSFLSDVRSMSHKKFQEQIIRDKIKNIDEDWSMIGQVSVAKRALVVLDDIDDSKQLELLTWENWGGPGSRIIVTTRDKHVLNLARIDIVYKMEGLEYEEALRLFSWHAFLRPEPDMKYKQHSERIVDACFGLPLAIEATANLLHDKKESLEYWREALSTPQSICHQKIYEVLKISYDNLTYQEKKIFQDIACIFRGKETKQGIRHWKRLNWDAHTAITNLELKSLISIGDGNVFMMHNLLRDMGKAIREADNTSPFAFNFLPPTILCRKFGRNKRLESTREGESPLPRLRKVQEARRLEVVSDLLSKAGFGTSASVALNLL